MKSLKLLIIVVTLFGFSCVSKTEDNLEINLDQIHIDYHYIESIDSIHDSLLYAPENVGFFFTIVNNTEENRILYPLSKFSYASWSNEYGRFKMIYKKDTVTLMTITDKVEIRPSEKIDVVAELPYESYFILKEISNNKNLKPSTLKDFGKAKFIYSTAKKNEGGKIPREINIEKGKVDLYLIYSDTAIVLKNI